MAIFLNKFFQGVKLLCFIPLFFSCDFTSSLSKDVILAQQYLQKGNYQASVLKYKEILRHNPSHLLKVKIYYQLGEIYSLYLHQGQESLYYYDQALAFSENNNWYVKVLEKKAEIYFTMLKKYNMSSLLYENLYKFEPKLDKVDFYRFRQAVSLRKGNKILESVKIFQEIIQDEKNAYFLESQFELALSYFYSSKWDEAINQFMQYLKYEKNKEKIIQTKFLIANSYETKGLHKEAYDIYFSLLSEYPNPEIIKSRLKSLYSRRSAIKR